VAERLYSVDQAAALLGTPPREVRQWIDAGDLAAERPAGDVRISERSLVRFLTDRGIDLGEILGEATTADDQPAPQAEPPQPPGRAPATRLAEAILADAIRRGADAIRLEPVGAGLTLKLRVDGQLREKPRFASRLPAGLGPRLLARFREMARNDTTVDAENRFTIRLEGRAYTFRLEEEEMPDGPGLVVIPVADDEA